MTDLEVRGRAVLEPVRVQWSWWRSRDRRLRLHTRPLVAPATGGRHRLPGIAVDTVLHEAPDPYRRPVGIVLVPSSGHVSLTLGSGRRALDEAWATDVGAWLATRAHESDASGCAVVVRRRGGRLQVLVQPTWRTTGPEGRTDPPALAVEVCARVPRLVQSLAHGRVGTARPLTAGQLASVVHDAYHPAGQAPGGSRPWSQAGPATHAERWNGLAHAGAASLTLSMSRVPSEVVLSSMTALVDAVPEDAARTQIVVCWTPSRPDGPHGGTFRSLVTVTTPAGADRVSADRQLCDAAETVVAALPARLRPWMRPLYGSQAAAFAAGLPAGVLLGVHAARPTLIAGAE
jgi:hypothetical protein